MDTDDHDARTTDPAVAAGHRACRLLAPHRLAALLAAHYHGDIHDRRRSEEREEPCDHRLVDDDHEGGSAEDAGQQTEAGQD